MVEATARFAYEYPATLNQAWAFLERLQHEITTFLLAGDPGGLPCEPSPTLWHRIVAFLLGRKKLLWLDSNRRVFRRYDWPNGCPVPSSDGPWDAVITSYHSSPKMAQKVLAWIRRHFPIRDIQTTQQLVRVSTLPKSFVVVTLLPTSSELAAIAKWVRRWGGI